MTAVTQKTVRTKIPARLDRLPWSAWHRYIVVALGTVWILDGLEVTMKGTVGPTLRDQLGLSSGQVGMAASIYIAGAITGALFWGYLTDRLGRKKLFLVTLGVYMAGVILTTISWGFVSFVVFRAITGFGIGGEYSAINSAIDELIPARVRGWVDLAINGSYWLGAAVAAALGVLYLHLLPADYGWRAGFATGAILSVGILLLRRSVPESPRWLMTHGQEEEAERITRSIEAEVSEDQGVGELSEPSDDDAIEIRERRSIGFVELSRTLVKVYPERTTVGFALMATQAFLYNAIFFTYGLILTTFYGVSSKNVGYFMLPFAAGNFLGPVLLGRWFDTVGRRPMIAGSYIGAGVLTIAAGYAFTQHWLGTVWLTIAWSVIFFLASAGASAGYLTVSETFPLEIRAMAIAFFYSVSTAVGGIIGPWLFGTLIGDGNSRGSVFIGYLVGAGLMIIGGITELLLGVAAEQRSLEDIAMPLSAADADQGASDGGSHTAAGGLDPADRDSIVSFQEGHGIAADGRIGPETRGALHAASASEGTEGDGGEGLTVVDPEDERAVREFQRRHGLVVDGVIGAQSRGAIAFVRRVLPVDPTDPRSVARFQDRHGLRPDGMIGPQTRATLRAAALRLEQDETGDDDDRQVGDLRFGFDPADGDDIRAFQRAAGLEPDGEVGPETRGALLAARAVRARTGGIDVTDTNAVRAFQRRYGLVVDGIVGPWTQAALREVRGRVEAVPSTDTSIVDPADIDAVRALQEAVGLEPTGTIDEETRHALAYERDHNLGVDPTDPDSIRAYQARRDLRPDGIIGPETRGAMQADRAEQEPSDDDEREAAYGRFARSDGEAEGIDPVDVEAVRALQEQVGIAADGVIGPETQAALRALGLGVRHPQPAAERPHLHRYRRLALVGGPFSTAQVPEYDDEVDTEVEAVVEALRELGSASKPELADAVDARHWGPGRLRAALHAGEDDGVIRRASRRRYELAGASRSSEQP